MGLVFRAHSIQTDLWWVGWSSFHWRTRVGEIEKLYRVRSSFMFHLTGCWVFYVLSIIPLIPTRDLFKLQSMLNNPCCLDSWTDFHLNSIFLSSLGRNPFRKCTKIARSIFLKKAPKISKKCIYCFASKL